MFSKKSRIFLFLLYIFSVSHLFSAEKKISREKLPLIPLLSSRNDIFQEYSAIVDENYKALASGQDTLMVFFKCQVPENMNLLALASRCNIPYETIATLNHIGGNQVNLTGKEILLPTVPGLFISTTSDDSLQVILKTRCIEILQNDNVCYNFGTETMVFLKNERFNPTERAYFLDTSLGLPIQANQFIISSGFGPRINPFSGEWKDHKGIDFAAQTGTPVFAVTEGIVSFAKYDTTFGNYIILKHRNADATSVYAHLDSMSVKYGDKIKKGDIIGYVGQTGLATGPHLHFEIRFGGIAEDPEKLLPVKKR